MSPKAFVERSVCDLGEGWTDMFWDCLNRAKSVSILKSNYERGAEVDALFEMAADHTAGLALLRSQELAAEAGLLAISDGGEERFGPGANAFIWRWRENGHPSPEIIDCPWRSGGTVREASASPAGSNAPDARAVLFVWNADDEKGQRRKRAEQELSADAAFMLARVDRLDGAIASGARVLGRLSAGAYAVFQDAETAAKAALDLLAGDMQGRQVRVVLDWGFLRLKNREPMDADLRRFTGAQDLPEAYCGVSYAAEAFAANLAFNGWPADKIKRVGAMGDAGPAPSRSYYRIVT